ncbi:MAG TPA: L,D-transpeptidase family protein [Gaiellaceae bacterium]|nr:L,D-transpeptidase family protein [Gaiellaceae bacterium]
MRCVVLLVVLVGALVGAAPAWSAAVTLRADHRVARYDDSVRFRGSVASAKPQQVLLVRDGVVLRSTVSSGGGFTFDLRARKPGSFVARTVLGESAPLVLRLQPRLRCRIVGRRLFGHRMFVVGRLLPAGAGRLVLGRVAVRVGPGGRFRARVPASREGFVARLRLRPKVGYVSVARKVRVRLAFPALQMGSHGPAVLALKQRLWQLRYALPSVDAGFGYKTYEAVMAFQKVHWMARTGRVDEAFWRALWRTSVPRPRVRSGNYLEVDKSRQVVMEVRGGRVERVVHASTGATGNTPVGTWRVYSEVAGWSWVLWQPMYFLRGFAIHGYPSVPPWPASHGCVRVPMWLATGLRERWGYGTTVRVYP